MLKKLFSCIFRIFNKQTFNKTYAPITKTPKLTYDNKKSEKIIPEGEKMELLFIMITHWNNHWRNEQITYYSKNLIYNPKNVDLLTISKPVKTLFIKVNQNFEFERAWEGVVLNLQEKNNRIQFKVEIQGEVDKSTINDIFGDLDLQPGWYIYASEGRNKLELTPPFFEKILSTTDWKEFENLGFILLKLLGINEIYQFPQENQAGLPDGVFKIRNLIVIFDFTLKKSYLDSKQQQINNYVSLLQKSEIRIYEKKVITLNNSDNRQVWIISRQDNKTIVNIGDIKVKEISVQTLFEVYKKRLLEIEGEENLVRLLSDL